MEDKWIGIIVSGIITFLASFSIHSIATKGRHKKEIRDQIDELKRLKADITYVDSKVNEAKEDSRMHLEQAMCLMQSIDANVKILLNKLK